MRHNKAQVREILSNYDDIDVLFFDGPSEGLTQLSWQLQPNVVITRGAMQTPEHHLPGEILPGAWEACYTIGTQWNYKPTNEVYRTGTQLIELLIETRAKGGNLLLNVSPDPAGQIPFEQDRLLREVGLWLFINQEAIYQVRPWHVTNEGNIWFTKAKDADTVYAFVTRTDCPWGERKTFTLKSVRATNQSKIEILGQSSTVLEYKPQAKPELKWTQDAEGLHISAMRSHRIYCDTKWPNPIVFKITNAKPVK